MYGLTVVCGTIVFLVPFMMLELVPICCKKCNKEAMTRIVSGTIVCVVCCVCCVMCCVCVLCVVCVCVCVVLCVVC